MHLGIFWGFVGGSHPSPPCSRTYQHHHAGQSQNAPGTSSSSACCSWCGCLFPVFSLSSHSAIQRQQQQHLARRRMRVSVKVLPFFGFGPDVSVSSSRAAQELGRLDLGPCRGVGQRESSRLCWTSSPFRSSPTRGRTLCDLNEEDFEKYYRGADRRFVLRQARSKARLVLVLYLAWALGVNWQRRLLGPTTPAMGGTGFSPIDHRSVLRMAPRRFFLVHLCLASPLFRFPFLRLCIICLVLGRIFVRLLTRTKARSRRLKQRSLLGRAQLQVRVDTLFSLTHTHSLSLSLLSLSLLSHTILPRSVIYF